MATGEVTDPEEVLVDYGDDEWEAVVLPALRAATVTEIVRRLGMDRTALSDYLRSRSPRRAPESTRTRLSEIAWSLLDDAVVRPCAVPVCRAWAGGSPRKRVLSDAGRQSNVSATDEDDPF